MSVAENLAFRSFDENGGSRPAFWLDGGADRPERGER